METQRIPSDSFDIILIAAGLSTRLNGHQKALHNFAGETLLFYSLSSALKTSDVALVVGHEKDKVIKEALRVKEQLDAINSSNQYSLKHNLNIVYNENYKEGQYSSVVCGVKAISGTRPFALSLCDLPFVRSEDYTALFSALGSYDVLRPFIRERGTDVLKPSHPVFFKGTMKEFFLNHENFKSVRSLLEECKGELSINNFEYNANKKMNIDFDYESDFDKN